MLITELSDENIADYTSYMGEDMAENIGREFFCGIVVSDESGEGIAAGMIWEYRNYEEDDDTQSVIEWIRIYDEQAADVLFDAYGAMIKENGVVQSRFVIPVKDYKTEREALKNAGFTAKLTEGDNIIVSLSELSALPAMKTRKVPDNIGTLSELTLRRFRKGITKTVMNGKRGLCEDLPYLSMTWFDSDVSVYSHTNDEINGFLLFHKLPSGMLSVQLMVCFGKDFQRSLLGMARKFVISMEEHYSPDTKVLLNRHNYASLQLTEKLLPRGFGIPVYAGSREEK